MPMVTPLAAGNAVHMILRPPHGAVRWRILRRPVNAMAGPGDPAAAIIADNLTVPEVTDIMGLVNGTTYYYWAYFRDARGEWMDDVQVGVATPSAGYVGGDLDVQTLVRDRLDLGVQIEVQRKAIKPSPVTGQIEVLMTPFGLSDKIAFPTISVHMDSITPEVRAIGEAVMADQHKPDGGWEEHTGWLSRVTLNVVGVTDNATTRVALRRSIARVMQANLPVFASRDLQLVDFSQRDHEDTEHYNVPLFFSIGTFSCIAPSWITQDPGEIERVDVTQYEYGGFSG